MTIEFALLNAIQHFFRHPFVDDIMIFISTLGNYGGLWIIMGLGLFIYPKTRPLGMVMLLALVLDAFLCNGLIKPLVQRERPFTVVDMPLLIAIPTDYSFPSGHTAASFAAVFAIYWEKYRGLFYFSLLIAFIMAFSRLYLYVHYPTDVLAGMVVGLVAAYLAHKIKEKIYKENGGLG